jgi:hypothetical protein
VASRADFGDVHVETGDTSARGVARFHVDPFVFLGQYPIA